MIDAEKGPERPVGNVIAELKGTALPNEYVVLSGHFDSFTGGSGATDNATGSLTMIEAMRILKGIGISIGAGRLSVEYRARSPTAYAPTGGRRRAH